MQRCGAAFFAGTFLLFLLNYGFPSAAQSAKPEESQAEKIKRALSAGPATITDDAAVAEIDSDGGMRILRQGTNDFTCMPGDPDGIGRPAMCADKVAMQWNSDFEQHKATPSTTVPGIEYMLAGGTYRSATDPYATSGAPFREAPHWIILWPFDPSTTGLPAHLKQTGTWIMWAGTPWSHLMINQQP